MQNKNRAVLDITTGSTPPPRRLRRRRFVVAAVILPALFTWQTIPKWIFDQLDKRRGGDSQLPTTKKWTPASEG